MLGAIKITKDSNSSHNKYDGYGICFDSKSDFSFGNIVNGKNVIIFGAGMSFSSHKRNRANNIYVLGKDFIQGVTTVGPTALSGSANKGTTIYSEKTYKSNFTEPNKKKNLFCHYTATMVIIFIYLPMEVKN